MNQNYKKLKKKFKCSKSIYRPNLYQIETNVHSDILENTSKTIQENAKVFTDEMIEDKDKFEQFDMYNFWAVLGPTIDYPLGFGTPDILEENAKRKDDVNAKDTTYKMYYTPEMDLGQFYIFNSFKVPHGRLVLNKDSTQYSCSVEIRCFAYQKQYK